MTIDWERLSDRVNPIVIHELRRGLRSRVFSVSFALLLAACVLISLVSWAFARTTGSGSGGAVFVAFYACLALVSFFIVPFTAFRSVAREREEKTWSQVVLTGLTPAQILRGKILSFVLQALLLGSVTAPFLLFSYLLQGMDLLTVLIVLAMSLCLQLFLTVLCAALATLPETTFWRGALQFIVLGALASAGQAAVGLAAVAVNDSTPIVSDKDVLLTLGVMLWLMAAYGAVAFSAGSSRLTFESDDYARLPRLAFAILVVGSLLMAVMGRAFVTGRAWGPAVTLPLLVNLFVFGAVSIGERDGLARRLRESPPGFTLFGLLLPGALRGYRFFVLLTLLTAAGGVVLCRSGSGPSHDFALPLAGAAGFTLLFMALAVLLGRGLLAPIVSTPGRLRAFAILLVAFASLAPLLLGALLGVGADDEVVNVLNPMLTTAEWLDDAGMDDHSLHIELICTLAIVATLVCDRFLAHLDARSTLPAPALSTEAASG